MQNGKIKAERVRGGKVMTSEFSIKNWNSGVPQKTGWKQVTEFGLSKEVEESKAGRESTNIAMQEQLIAKDTEIFNLKKENDSLSSDLLAAKQEIESLKNGGEPALKKRGPKPKAE